MSSSRKVEIDDVLDIVAEVFSAHERHGPEHEFLDTLAQQIAIKVGKRLDTSWSCMRFHMKRLPPRSYYEDVVNVHSD